ncbi:hypothetical protein EMPS_09710 [Entomortierella parvispora]|uniref:BLOC-1-related complex subunit 5 n=1 Tax=Entomortierella parvispora TaxID=205924 RepID=A0A9P3M0A6_9FUNG|nr:hypothetical protein EMPS_09710 [Entomortierella parvispora]
MEQENYHGIVTVSGQEAQAEDEMLQALRALPRFEPLVVPETPSHFSLSSVFGALSTSQGPKRDTAEVAFNPNVLVDILIQMNTHSKKCALDIQAYQRSLALRMKTLDDYTAEAVHDLIAVQQQAKSHADQLLSVHALAKQADVTKALLANTLQKLQDVSRHLPPTPEDPSGEEPDSSPWPYLDPVTYPTLHHFLHQGTASHLSDPPNFKQPSGLALLGGQGQGHGHGQGQSSAAGASSQYYLAPTGAARSRSPALVSLAPTFSIPKASPSMALASNSTGATLSAFTASSSSSSSSPLHKVGRDQASLDSLASYTSSSSSSIRKSQTTTGQWPPTNQNAVAIAIASPQPTTSNAPRASDNLRRLASQAGSHPPPPHPHYWE